MVREIDPVFAQSQLEIFSQSDNSFISYDGDSFDQYLNNLPQFQIKLFDTYSNPVSNWPGW